MRAGARAMNTAARVFTAKNQGMTGPESRAARIFRHLGLTARRNRKYFESMFPRAQLIGALLLLIAVAGAGSSYHRHNAFVTVFHEAQAVAVIGMILAMAARSAGSSATAESAHARLERDAACLGRSRMPPYRGSALLNSPCRAPFAET